MRATSEIPTDHSHPPYPPTQLSCFCPLFITRIESRFVVLLSSLSSLNKSQIQRLSSSDKPNNKLKVMAIFQQQQQPLKNLEPSCARNWAN